MKRGIVSLSSLILMLTALIVFTGCSNGGSTSSSGTTTTGTVSSLEIGDRVSVVDAQESSGSGSTAALKMGVIRLLSASDLPADSAYNTDVTFVYVEERSAESFNIINEILCMMGQSGYDDMVNKGTYKAQIDIGQCENSKDSASSAGESSQNQSSGANSTEYEFWTVNSSRADNTSSQIVKIWIHEKAEDMGGGVSEPAKTIMVKTVISESATAANPYGIFTMNFSAVSDDNGSVMFSGYLRSEEDSSGEVLLKFYDNGSFGPNDEITFSEKVTLNRSSSTSSGAGSISIEESNPFDGASSKSFNIAYNDSYFLRSDGTDEVCMSRTNPDSSVWRYGLYYDENHATPGGRLTINSGFPIKYVSNEGTSYHGWAGFYGLWFPGGVSLSSGDTVYKQEYSESGTTETEYTIFIVSGKLRKHTKKTVTLSEMKNIPLSWNECTDLGGGNWSCSDTRVIWNGTNLVKNAVRSNSTNWTWKEITEEAVTFSLDAWDFNFYSEALGGSGRVNLKDPDDPTGQNQIALTDSTVVVFHIEDTVYPGDSGIPASLACFENCPEPSNINSADPYFVKSTWQESNNFSSVNMSTAPGDLVAGTNYIAYTFDTDSMLLKYDNTAATMTSSTNSQNGVWTGAMFEPTSTNLALLACDWDQTSSSTCTWQAWDKLDVFYTWETGTQQWNKLTALQSGSTFLSFDPPVSVEYTHTNGSKFFLEYNGFGDLHGIPGKCVDEDTGLDTECWDESGAKFIRWVPDFSIADGTAVTDASSSATYYVKGLEKEERMRAESNSTPCTDAGLTLQSYTLPDANLYEAPDIGDEPAVDSAPAVIAGVLQ